MQTATEQIAAAEQAAIRQIKDRAVTVAVAAAGDVLREQDEGRDANRLIDTAIAEVGDEAALIPAVDQTTGGGAPSHSVTQGKHLLLSG